MKFKGNHASTRVRAIANLGRQAESRGNRRFQRPGIGVLDRGGDFGRRAGTRAGPVNLLGAGITDQGLGLPHIQAAEHHPLGEGHRVAGVDQRAGVAGAQPAVDDHRLNRRRQRQQAHKIGDMAPAFADRFGDFVLAAAKILDQTLIAGGFLDSVEVGSLDIFDKRDFQHGGVVELPHDHRHVVYTGLLRRSPPALAGDDLKIALGRGIRPHQDRL